MCKVNVNYKWKSTPNKGLEDRVDVMSYTELESGYQGLQNNRPGFYVGHDGNLIALVSDLKL